MTYTFHVVGLKQIKINCGKSCLKMLLLISFILAIFLEVVKSIEDASLKIFYLSHFSKGGKIH